MFLDKNDDTKKMLVPSRTPPSALRSLRDEHQRQIFLFSSTNYTLAVGINMVILYATISAIHPSRRPAGKHVTEKNWYA